MPRKKVHSLKKKKRFTGGQYSKRRNSTSSLLLSLRRRLRKTWLEDGKVIGGTGRLSEKRIQKLQFFYGKAIRQNTHSIRAMQNAVMAIWHHSKSTDENPDHDLCQEGENSWCGFQRDVAKGTTVYVYKNPIPEAVADVIYSTFEALSEESLL